MGEVVVRGGWGGGVGGGEGGGGGGGGEGGELRTRMNGPFKIMRSSH